MTTFTHPDFAPDYHKWKTTSGKPVIFTKLDDAASLKLRYTISGYVLQDSSWISGTYNGYNVAKVGWVPEQWTDGGLARRYPMYDLVDVGNIDVGNIDVGNIDVVPFNRLTRYQQVELFEAWLDGEPIEMCQINTWVPVVNPSWADDLSYRIKAIDVTPDVIPWTHIKMPYKWAARNKNGNAYVFINKPALGELFFTGDNAVGITHAFTDYHQGTCDWKDSLQHRPE